MLQEGVRVIYWMLSIPLAPSGNIIATLYYNDDDGLICCFWQVWLLMALETPSSSIQVECMVAVSAVVRD